MFECQACLRRSLYAVASVHPSPQWASLRSAAVAAQRRHQSLARSREHAEQSAVVAAASKERRNPSAWNESAKVSKIVKADREALHKTTKAAKPQKEEYARLRKEMRYLQDPLKLAERVSDLLKGDEEEKALAMVRLGSRGKANVVAWNHIIDWQMKRGKTKGAIDTYNEMKKRALKPDSYTFLLLLRGLAMYAHHSESLGRALSLYHAISAPKSPVSATIMHTNAVLKVCARARDMDSMWDIASRLPEKGPHAADNWTFTTLLNTIRLNALTGGATDEAPEDEARRRETAIIEGRKLWAIIIQRWRAGDLLVDEELTCAMGRLLLIGARPRDWDDVLSLLHQAMGMPRLVPRLGSAPRPNTPTLRAPNTPSEMKHDSDYIPDKYGDYASGTELDVFTPPSSQNEDSSGENSDSRSGNKIVPKRNPTVERKLAFAYASPSNSTLSLVIEACLKTVARPTAKNYWDLLTDPTGPYQIAPDLDNIHMYLRILRQARAAAATRDLLDTTLHAYKIQPVRKTFTIALAACARATSDPSRIITATQILHWAAKSLAEPGPKIPFLYLQLADETGEPGLIVGALERLDDGGTGMLRQCRTLLTLGSEESALLTKRSRPSGRELARIRDEAKRDRIDAMALFKLVLSTATRALDLSEGRVEADSGSWPVSSVGEPGQKKRLAITERQVKYLTWIRMEAGKIWQRQKRNSERDDVAQFGWRSVGVDGKQKVKD